MADKDLKVGVGSNPGVVIEQGGHSQQPPDEEIHKLECRVHGNVVQLRGLAPVSSRSEGVVDSHTVTSTDGPVASSAALEEDSRPSMKDILSNSAAQTMSAGLYLFDHISNIVVLIQYYILSKTGKFNNIVINMRHFKSTSKVPFYVCLGFMICDPTVAAVAFTLRLEPEEHPLRSALFLPIIQFKRFFAGIWKPSSWASSLEMKESLETEALFSIVTAMETIPQLILQFAIIYYFAYTNQGIPPAILVISVVALFLSASYNAGRAVMYQMSKKWTSALDVSGIVGGMYTIGAMLLRFSAVSAVISAFGSSFSGNSFKTVMTVYFVVGVSVLSYVNGLLDHLLKGREICSWRAQVNIIVASYICATIGPLYPVIEYDNGDVSWSSSLNPKRTLLVRLGLAIGINMLPDVLIVILSSIRTIKDIYPTCSGTTTTNYSWISCHEFITFVTIGSALSILPCIIFPCLVSVAPNEQCESHLDDVPINGATAVNVQTIASSGPYKRARTSTAGNAGVTNQWRSDISPEPTRWESEVINTKSENLTIGSICSNGRIYCLEFAKEEKAQHVVIAGVYLVESRRWLPVVYTLYNETMSGISGYKFLERRPRRPTLVACLSDVYAIAPMIEARKARVDGGINKPKKPGTKRIFLFIAFKLQEEEKKFEFCTVLPFSVTINM